MRSGCQKVITKRMSNIITKTKIFLSRKENIYFLTVFFISFLIHFCVSLIGWNNPLLDQHGFRQTQTAITTFYTVMEGFRLDYITPVLGAPWSIPFEFPLYQWIVAIFVIIFKTPIDQTGRFVSLTFFYLSLLPLGLILKIYFKKISYVLIVLSFVLLNPIYLFWSRAYMIESLALFLGLLFVWLVIIALRTNKWLFIILAIIVGSLSALVKITTFFALGFSAGCVLLFYFYKDHGLNYIKYKVIGKYIIYVVLLFVIPVSTGFMWTKFADSQKSLNPLAKNFITSENLSGWNFGTLDQKLDIKTWIRVVEHSVLPETTFKSDKLSYSLIILLLLSITLFLFSKWRQKLELVSVLVLFLVGPLVFTNLYFVHSYYYFANNFFISIIFGILVISVCKRENLYIKYLGIVLIFPLLLVFNFFQYKDGYYYSSQITNNYPLIKIASVISEITSSEDTIIVYGYDWDSSLPYYSKRKAIMNRGDMPIENAIIQESIENSGNIGALIMTNRSNEEFINQQISKLGFKSEPYYSDGHTYIYVPR